MDKSRFVSQAVLDEKGNATAEVFFKESEGSLQSVFDSDRHYCSAGMKKVFLINCRCLAQKFLWQSLRFQAKLEENIQRRNQNICHA